MKKRRKKQEVKKQSLQVKLKSLFDDKPKLDTIKVMKQIRILACTSEFITMKKNYEMYEDAFVKAKYHLVYDYLGEDVNQLALEVIFLKTFINFLTTIYLGD